ncbi:hypothetical protein BIV57_04740 [Mangrovactinospora gilvigrisea]|uniref:Lipoprotein n=1 Tax=Mangrovactinospora gilvigrisea TaxID=1428644 RepID=A0A1J7CAM5_9ACTN|nr:hypothetical protein [Mangrovactinospora gilvigrisea]OIV38568.1 hypothetical protein BIV57_04740 [Mangrovactinospora gilvigrisea]
MRGRSTRNRRTAGALGVLGVLAALAGCGIRPTAYPVDAGAPAGRADCPSASRPTAEAAAATESASVLYLVCGDRLATVARLTDTPPTAASLLYLLRQEALPYTTAVPQGLSTADAKDGDPAGAIRLSTDPARLSGWARAQLVCTFATNLHRGTGGIPLGGPDGAVHEEDCAQATRLAEHGAGAG